MKMVLLPTLDYPPQRGGVARYLHAIKKTFPTQVEVSYWSEEAIPSAKEATRRMMSEAKGFDAIWVSHILPMGTAALRVHMKTGQPYVVFLHGMDFDLARRSFVKRFVAKRILRSAEAIVTNSDALAKEVYYFCGRSNSIVVYPPIRDELLDEPLPKKQKTSKKLRLLTVGRLVERKGHIKVLEALKVFPDVEYRIVGDGPFRSEIEKKIKELKLSKRITIDTNVEDEQLPDEYRNADIFVMPTTKTKEDREGFGIVYLEAQLFGLPVIATKHPGVDEAVVDKGTGFLIVDHPDALTIALRQLIENAELRKRMGRAGHEFVLGGFTRETQMAKLKPLLD